MSNLRIKYKKLKRDYEVLKNMALPTRTAYVSTNKNVDKVIVRKVLYPNIMDNPYFSIKTVDEEVAYELGKYAMDNGYIEKDRDECVITYTACMVK